MEKEQLIKVKDYMDLLAMGINPVSGETASQGDVINDPELIRAFHCASSVLRDVIANGGKVSSRGSKKLPFDISDEALAGFSFSDDPIGVTEIGNRINALVNPEEMKLLKITTITAFMVQAGMLQEIQEGSSRRKTPTKAGLDAGLSEAQFTGRYGAYSKVLYNRDMQQFILDNMLTIIELNNGKAA